MDFLHRKILSFDQLSEEADRIRERGQTIALSHGVFDILHPGHYRHLKAASQLADRLFVTLTGDDFVGKGPGRPVFPQALRAEVLASLEAVDYVSVVMGPVALPAIEALRPDYYVKGQEYVDESADVTRNMERERLLVEVHGGQVAFTDDIVFSSSKIINTFLPTHDAEVRAWLAEFKESHTVNEVLEWIDRAASLKVVAIGETIVDEYTTCETLGKASKEPVLCLNRGSTVRHAGGILAVAGHAAGLGASTTVVTGSHSADADSDLFFGLEDNGVLLERIDTDPHPTIRKERMIDGHTQSRVMELYTMNDSPLPRIAEQAFKERVLAATKLSDIVIVVDYGHGLISNEVALGICASDAFVAVNTQSNAGNRGFNSLTKYPRANFATMNGSEARLEARQRHVDLDAFVPRLVSTLGTSGILITQGADGLDHYLSDGSVLRSKALAPFVKDRVGAGDAVLTVTSMLVAAGAPPKIVGLVGNVVGAWAVSFLGNEQTVNSGQLKRQITSLLK